MATKTGIVFLLAKESGLEKWYYGFDTYVMLSSGIVRYFLELCEQASKCSEDRAHYIYDCFKETATPIMSIDYDLATKIYSVFYTAGGITTTKRVQFSNVPRVLESMPAISFKNVLVDITSLQHSVIMFIIIITHLLN